MLVAESVAEIDDVLERLATWLNEPSFHCIYLRYERLPQCSDRSRIRSILHATNQRVYLLAILSQTYGRLVDLVHARIDRRNHLLLGFDFRICELNSGIGEDLDRLRKHRLADCETRIVCPCGHPISLRTSE